LKKFMTVLSVFMLAGMLSLSFADGEKAATKEKCASASAECKAKCAADKAEAKAACSEKKEACTKAKKDVKAKVEN